MQRGVPVIACTCLAGCAQLFGIDNTTGVDAAPPGVSIALQRASVGATVIKAPLDLSGQTATWLVPDAAATGGFTKVPGTVVLPGTWSADLADGMPAVQFTLPDLPMPHAHLWQLPSRAMRGNFVVYEHPNPQPPSATSQLQVDVTLPTPYAGEGLVLDAIGPWMAHSLGTGELPAMAATTVSATIPYAMLTSQTGWPAARITSSDVLLLLRYVGSHLTGVLPVPAFEQTDAADPVSGTLTELTDDQTLSATIAPATIANRFVAVRPAVAGPAMGWTITAAPGHALGLNTGVTLQAGVPAMMDTQITAGFTNPFESLDWRSMFELHASETRSFALPAGGALGLRAGLTTVGAPAMGLTLDLPVGLPELISIDQKPLTSDGMMVTLDLTQPLVVTFVADQAANTLYELVVAEVTADATTATRQTIVDLFATNASFSIPPELLQAGHTYVLTASCISGGFTGAATGELQNVTLPYSYGFLDSGVFTVVAQ